MPIIIISNQFDPDKPVAQNQPAQTPTAVQPAPGELLMPTDEELADIRPPQQPAQIQPKPKKKEIDPALGEEAANRLNEMAMAYQNATDDFEKGDWVKAIFNFPFVTGPLAGGTVGSWLVNKYVGDNKKRDRADAKSEVMIKILDCLNSYKPGDKILGCFGVAVGRESRKEHGRERAVGSQNLNENLAILEPYFRSLQNPNAPTGKRIAPDLITAVENGSMKPYEAAWLQYKRDIWKDVPNPETGQTRIEDAVKAFSSLVEQTFYPNQRAELQQAIEAQNNKEAANPPKNNRQIDQYERDKRTIRNRFKINYDIVSFNPIEIKSKPIDSKKQFRDLRKALISKGVDISAFDDEKSPLWLNEEMIESRVFPEMLKYMWDTYGSSNVSMDASPEGETGKQLPSLSEDISEKEWRRQRHDRPEDLETHKTLIQDVPNQYLQDFKDPAQRDKIERRLPMIQPADNPNFFHAIKRIVDNLYGGAYTAPATDAQGQMEERTKEVLYMIGQFYANTLKDNRSEETRLRELEQSLTPYLAEPISLKHYEGPPLKANQQFAFALREVMLDMMDYLSNDANYQKLLTQMAPKAVAELKTKIRTAGLSFVSALISWG